MDTKTKLTPCGLSQEKLDAHGWVENQCCTALVEGVNGNRSRCNSLYTSHPSRPPSAQGNEQFFLPILFNLICFEIVPLYVASHFLHRAVCFEITLYISHLISPTRLLLSVK